MTNKTEYNSVKSVIDLQIIDWRKVALLLLALAVAAFVADEYFGERRLRPIYEDAADKIRPLVGMKTRAELAAEKAASVKQQQELLDARNNELLMRQKELLAANLASVQAEETRQREAVQQREAEIQQEKERLAKAEQERADRYVAAYARARAFASGELPEQPAKRKLLFSWEKPRSGSVSWESLYEPRRVSQPNEDALRIQRLRLAGAQEAAFRATRNRLGVEIMQPDLDPNQRVRMKSEWEAYGRAIKEVSRVR